MFNIEFNNQTKKMGKNAQDAIQLKLDALFKDLGIEVKTTYQSPNTIKLILAEKNESPESKDAPASTKLTSGELFLYDTTAGLSFEIDEDESNPLLIKIRTRLEEVDYTSLTN